MTSTIYSKKLTNLISTYEDRFNATYIQYNNAYLELYDSKYLKPKDSQANIELDLKIINLTKILHTLASNEDDIKTIEVLDIQCKELISEIKSDLASRIRNLSLITLSKANTINKKYLNSNFSILSDLETELESAHIGRLLHFRYKQESKNMQFINSIFDKIIPNIFKEIIINIRHYFFAGATIYLKKEKEKKKNEIEALKQEKDIISNKLRTETILPEAAQQCQTKLDDITKLITAKQSIINTINENFKKASETRINLRKIGGEAVKIETPHSKLDATYMSVDVFRENISKAKGKSFCIELPSLLSNQKDKSIQGFIFDRHEFQGSNLESILSQLGINTSGAASGWTLMTTADDHVMILSSRDLIKLRQHHQIINETFVGELNVKDIDLRQSSDAGTVILTFGIGGTYEIYKYEIMALLLKGVNVMAFNFSGYGKSTGSPNGEIIKHDLEAVYQYIKKEHFIPDEKILVKSLCISGGAGSSLIAAHPKINLLLDQSFADFKWVIQHELNLQFEKYFKFNIIKNSVIRERVEKWTIKFLNKVASVIIPFIIPSWKTKVNITKIDGNLGLFFTKKDAMMKLDHVYENYKCMVKAGKGHKVTVYGMEGAHATNWQYIWERIYSPKEMEQHFDLSPHTPPANKEEVKELDTDTTEDKETFIHEEEDDDAQTKIIEQELGVSAQEIAKMESVSIATPAQGEIPSPGLNQSDPSTPEVTNGETPAAAPMIPEFKPAESPGICTGHRSMDLFLDKIQIRGNLFA